MTFENKSHWENIYETKQSNEVSWTQNYPKTSLEFIHDFNLPKTASVIDVGGGDSNLVDFLLEEGYQNITVLDISEHALERAKKRLGDKAAKVKWIVSDITDFKPEENYDLWHDRAVFHFLTMKEHIEKYLEISEKCLNRFMVIGTFSSNGPRKCSGLDVKQYTEEELQMQLTGKFQKIKCITEDHITPFNTIQNFLFCSFCKPTVSE